MSLKENLGTKFHRLTILTNSSRKAEIGINPKNTIYQVILYRFGALKTHLSLDQVYFLDKDEYEDFVTTFNKD